MNIPTENRTLPLPNFTDLFRAMDLIEARTPESAKELITLFHQVDPVTRMAIWPQLMKTVTRELSEDKFPVLVISKVSRLVVDAANGENMSPEDAARVHAFMSRSDSELKAYSADLLSARQKYLAEKNGASEK